ncbi:hypothetical protein D1AOALGA4SA_355 [Olavius algarvensis Delta 1 endosymbiont]|nr:hypothetical protein D1AOALGA4SA_355 [Olavius algarvensis Delta 1 endosymbiont]
MFCHPWPNIHFGLRNADCGLRIVDLRYSACRELLCRTVDFINKDRAKRYRQSDIQNLKSKI